MSERRRSKVDATRLGPWLCSRSAFFKRMDPKTTEALLERGRVRRYARNSVVCRQGESALTFYVVVEGTLSAKVSREGVEREIGSYQSGEFAGGLALMRQQPWPFSLHAGTDVEAIEFDARAISQYIAALRPTAIDFLRHFSSEMARDSRDLYQKTVSLVGQINAQTRGSGGTFRREDR